MRSICSPYVNKGRLRAFLKNHLIESCRIAQSEQKLAMNKLGLIQQCSRCKRASEMSSDLCDCVRL
jgi:hypothetical protein